MAKKKYKSSVLNRINPDKGNRMVFAVGIGFAVIFLIWIVYMLTSGEGGPPQAIAEKTLEYVDKAEGVTSLTIEMDQNRVSLRYDPSKPGDYVLITRYAAIKLSNRLPDLTIDFTLTPELPKAQTVYRCQVKDGTILSEWQGVLPKIEKETPPPTT